MQSDKLYTRHWAIPSLLLILFFLLIAGCKEQTRTPLEVTEDFWGAVQEKDLDAIKNNVASGSFDEDIETDNVLSVSKVRFGKILIDGNQSRIETEVTIDSDQPTTLPIDTRLVKENEQWKVDYRATMDAVTTPGQMTQLLNRLKTFSEKLNDEFGHSIEQFDQAMPEVEQQLGEMGEQLREKVPELKERFDELAEEIRKALQESLQAPGNDDNTEDDPVDEDSYSI